MTAIVGVINSQGIAIAADSALTVSGGNVKKVYNKSNKIFTLSKYHPVGIAIYSSANFMGIPLETLIKMYRASLNDRFFDTLGEYKDDFLKFLADSIKYATPQVKGQQIYSLFSPNYNAIIEQVKNAIKSEDASLQQLPKPAAIIKLNEIAATEIQKYFDIICTYKTSETFKIDLAQIDALYSEEVNAIFLHIENEIKKVYSDITISNESKDLIKQMVVHICNLENIFELSCGLVFIGFGDKEVYPSSQVVTVGSAIANHLRYYEQEIMSISPGLMNSNILPYVQGDVTFSVLTGIDPAFKQQVNNSIETAFTTIANAIAPKIENADEAIKLSEAITKTSKELIQKLNDYQNSNITGPLLDTLVHMGKEDMAELAESLVNITSLKRKFTTATASDESVGGPVDVAIITKGDGFIWMKRKHYFEIDINKGFLNKYYKQ